MDAKELSRVVADGVGVGIGTLRARLLQWNLALHAMLDMQAAQHRVRAVCRTQEEYETAVSRCPLFDGTPARQKALERVGDLLVHGKSPEEAAQGANPYAHSIIPSADALARAGESAEKASATMTLFAPAYHATGQTRGRGRNRRFQKRSGLSHGR